MEPRPNRKQRRRERAFMRTYVKVMVKIRNFSQGGEEIKEFNPLNWAYRAVKAGRITTRQARMFGCKV